MFRQLGAGELLLILAVLLLFFGARKLPDLARSLGKSARELRKGLSGEDGEEEESESGGADAEAKTGESGATNSEPTS